MKFNHQQLIEDNEINVSNLPSGLQQSIQLFDEKLNEYELHEEDSDEDEVKALKTELKKLSSEIAEEIKEYLEEEEISDLEDEPLPKDKEGILRYLYENDIRKVSKTELKKYGYPIGFFDNFPMKGETIGKYRLFRNATDEPFQITKIK